MSGSRGVDLDVVKVTTGDEVATERPKLSSFNLSTVGASVSSILSSEEVARHFYRCVYVFSWACAGFATGMHWLYLAYAGVGLTQLDILDRWSCGRHFISYWMSALLAAGALLWVREEGEYVACPGNITLSRSCLFEVQSEEYRTVYTAALVAITYASVHWIIDGIQLLSWDTALRDGRHPKVLQTQIRLFSPAYWAFIAATVALVSLTWGLFMDWSTADDSIYVLLGVAAAEVLGCCAALHAGTKVWQLMNKR